MENSTKALEKGRIMIISIMLYVTFLDYGW